MQWLAHSLLTSTFRMCLFHLTMQWYYFICTNCLLSNSISCFECREDTYLFYRKKFYEDDPRQGRCHSFNFEYGVHEKGDSFPYCEGTIGDNGDAVPCNDAAVQEVTVHDSSAFVCFEFTWSPPNGNGDTETKYVWFPNAAAPVPDEAVMTSSCTGEPPLGMYRSQVSRGR